MVNVNKKYLEEKLKKEIWSELVSEIKKVKSNKDLEVFLPKFFTPSEIIMVEKRIGVKNLLRKGLSTREINLELEISLSSISFIKKGFKNPEKKIGKENLKKEEPLIPEWALKKNSKFPTSYSGKGRWRV